jgi:hypothetical protein
MDHRASRDDKGEEAAVPVDAGDEAHNNPQLDDDIPADAADDEDYDYGDDYDYGVDYIDDVDMHLFPTLPAFTIPVEIRPTPLLGNGQYGVFALEDIPPHTDFWKWTHRVESIHYTELEDYIAAHYQSDDVNGIGTFLRRGFVIPGTPAAPARDEYWNSNPTDAACYMNHSSTPNCGRPYGTLRLVQAGEELTVDYSGNGNPQWHIDFCHAYGILTSVEVVEEQRQRDAKQDSTTSRSSSSSSSSTSSISGSVRK